MDTGATPREPTTSAASVTLERAEQSLDVEKIVYHAERPGFRITELRISPTQQVPWHSHSHIQDTFFVLEDAQLGENSIVGKLETLLCENVPDLGRGGRSAVP